MSGYFRVTQKQSGGGSGATITVSYSSSFYSKTITCSDGTTTYTATTTSSGSTTFNVNAEGTWTITCDGTSKTVEVVLTYETQLSITKTITVYSAANDTVSFTDMAGSKTVTTDSSGEGSVSVTYLLGDVITFTSSVAKDPDSLSTDYSRQVTFAQNTQNVYVMPDNTLYWYGFNNGVESGDAAWMPGYTPTAVVFNTQYATVGPGGSSKHFSELVTEDSHDATKYHVVYENTLISTMGLIMFLTKSAVRDPADSAITYNALLGAQKITILPTDQSSPHYICIEAEGNVRAGKVYAVFYE